MKLKIRQRLRKISIVFMMFLVCITQYVIDRSDVFSDNEQRKKLIDD